MSSSSEQVPPPLDDDSPTDPFPVIGRRRTWPTVAALVTTLAILGGVLAWRIWGVESAEKLDITAVALGEPSEVAGELESGGDAPKYEPRRIGTVPIAVSFRNAGDQPITIPSAEAEVLQSARIEPCHASGPAGDSRITAAYTVQLPVEDVDGLPSPATGVTGHEVDLPLEPWENDWLDISVGPESQSDRRVQVVAYRLTLILDDGSRRELPSVATATSSGIVSRYVTAAGRIPPSRNKAASACAKRGVQTLDRVLKAADLQTGPIKDLRDAYARLGAEK